MTEITCVISFSAGEEEDKVLHEADELCDIDWDPVDGLDAEDQAVASGQLIKRMDKCFDLQTRITEMGSRKKKQ